MTTDYKIITEFQSAMQQAGIITRDDIQADGEFHRIRVDGDRGKNGWYILHADGVPAGEFGCWKRGVSQTWCAKAENTMSPADLAEVRKRQEAAKAKREAETKRRQEEAAKRAVEIYEQAQPAESHPYLTRKRIQAHGVRVGRWTKTDDDGRVWLDVQNALIIPIRRSANKIVSLQAVFPDSNNPTKRDKDYLGGGERLGCYYLIGKPDGDRPTLVICEGFATGASIHEATGYTVLVAFDTSNLKPVAEKARKLFPAALIILAADNDRWTETPVKNPGLHYARQAAAAVNGRLALAEFGDLTGNPTDFNDLANTEGPQAVRALIDGQPKQQVADYLPAADEDDDEPPALPPKPANDNAVTVGNDLTQGVDWWTPFPDINGKGKPLATIENLNEALRRLQITCRYNVIRKEIELLVPRQGFSIDNQANASLSWLISCCVRFGMPTGNVPDFLTYIADQNQYNPVANWITARPWDGVSRLAEFISTVTAEGEDDPRRRASVLNVKATLITRWMISAVAAAFEPNGVSAHGVLVLQGQQYLGKTAWFKSLAPKSLGVIQDGLSLRPDDRDSVKQVVSYWMVELGELDATFRKSDIAALKAFITRDHDEIRRAYARLESKYARRTVFFASVNPRQFLHDPTGNRRYWTISCQALNHNNGLDMQQVWAEVYETLYRTGEGWFLTSDEMQALNDSNKDFEVLDPITEKIRECYNWTTPPESWRFATITEILHEIGYEKPTRADLNHAGQVITGLNGERRKIVRGARMLALPPKNSTMY